MNDTQKPELTAKAVVTSVFELCEAVEDIATPPDAKQYEQGFKAGERFAAKHIRTAIGTWAWDEGITSKPQERDALTEICDRAKAVVDREPRHSSETLYALLSKEFAEAGDELISRAVALALVS